MMQTVSSIGISRFSVKERLMHGALLKEARFGGLNCLNFEDAFEGP
jgi:hypothetical protein